MNEETYRHLVSGARYRIARAFDDFDGRRWEAGTQFVFVSHGPCWWRCERAPRPELNGHSF